MAAIPPGIPGIPGIPGMTPIPLTISGSFNSAVEFDNLLARIGLSVRYHSCLITDEGTTTAQDLAKTRIKDLKTSLENIKNLFGSKPVNQRIYFAPRLMSKIVRICVYFRQCIMPHRIPDIRLIDNFRVQEFVSKVEEWDKEEGTTTNSSVKISDFKFDQQNITVFNDKLVTLLS